MENEIGKHELKEQYSDLEKAQREKNEGHKQNTRIDFSIANQTRFQLKHRGHRPPSLI
jgi:hypothetical protein